jgi:hypothetical protein
MDRYFATYFYVLCRVINWNKYIIKETPLETMASQYLGNEATQEVLLSQCIWRRVVEGTSTTAVDMRNQDVACTRCDGTNTKCIQYINEKAV